MDLERFLLEHHVTDVLSTLFWMWVGLGLAIFYLLYRTGLAQLPRPGAGVRGLGRGILALLLFALIAPFMAGGGGYRPGQGWDDDLDG
jgi:hypothetical protein